MNLLIVVVDARIEEIRVERFLCLFGSCFIINEEVILYLFFGHLLVQEVSPALVLPAVFVFALCQAHEIFLKF